MHADIYNNANIIKYMSHAYFLVKICWTFHVSKKRGEIKVGFVGK